MEPLNVQQAIETRAAQVDEALREDAAAHPAYAAARRSAVVSLFESTGDYMRFEIDDKLVFLGCSAPLPSVIPSVCAWLREYEKIRGAASSPSRAADAHAAVTFGTDAQACYRRIPSQMPRTSPEERMKSWWRDVARIGEGASWVRLDDGRVVPKNPDGSPRALSAGEAYGTGCPCGPGALVHLAPCHMADP